MRSAIVSEITAAFEAARRPAILREERASDTLRRAPGKMTGPQIHISPLSRSTGFARETRVKTRGS